MADLDIDRDGKVSAEEKAADLNNDKKIDSAELIQYDARVAKETSAYDFLVNRYNNAGMPELGQWIANTIKGDPSLLDKQGELTTLLYDSEPYKKRFSGLTQLREHNKKNPNNPVYVPSEIQYLETESQMRELLKPVAGMYKDTINTVIGNLIGNQISPAELQTRVVIANNWVMSTDPNVKKALKEYYGIDDNHLLGFALDPETGTAEIEKVASATQLGAQALSSQVSLTAQESESLIQNLKFSEGYETLGRAAEEAAKTLAQLTSGTATTYNPSAGSLPGLTNLATAEGTQLGVAEILGAELGINTEASRKIAGLKSRERARFGAESGGTQVLAEQVSGTV